MNRRVDAHLARTQFGPIMARAVENSERFVVERRREPAVVIRSVQDFIRTPAPSARLAGESLEPGQKKTGLEKLSAPEIDAEITGHGARSGTDSRRHRHECSRVGHDFIVGQ